MKTLIIQNLTHRGTVAAEGFVLSAKLTPESEMRRRVLALWQTNTKVYRRGDDLIVLLPQSFRVDCRRAVGSPLVRYGDILSSFPLRKNDLENFANSGETIVLLNEGVVGTVSIRDLQTEAAENWFDISGFQIVETETLGEVETKPVIVEKVETINLRGELKAIPEADQEMAEILQTLKRKRDEIAKAKNNRTTYNGNVSGSITEGLSSIFDTFKNFFASKNELNRQAFDSQPKPPNGLRQMFTKALFQMKIAQMIGRKQAQYLAKMMEKFENGDLEEALKYAIPLEDMQALKEMSEQMPFLGFLRPRENLQINYGRQTTSSSSVTLENQWFDNLRDLYRQTFDRLVAQNRIEEAAFVLAELLKSSHEAVEFLEKHGKCRLAAQLAESRNLAKDIIVRQWFLAGEKRKAIQLAVLHDCFEYVVTKLEQENHPQASDLREVWAESLAESGNFQAAVNTIWKLENRRERAAEWIDKVIAFGGTPAARMLAKKVVLLPESFAAVKTKLLEILKEHDPEAVEKRAAFALETLQTTPNDELRTLARPLARKILSDMSKDNRCFTPQNLRRLVEVSNDYTLRTDLPKLSEIAVKKEVETFTIEIAENDRGANHIGDAHLLPDGKIALALGESGVKIVSREGKTIAHFDQPAHKLVVSDFGTKAICLARRGAVYRLAKVDFVERKSSRWCDAKIENYALTYDGNLWFIAGKDEIYAIDAQTKNFEAVWRVPEIGGRICEIARSENKLMLLVGNDRGFEKWWYDLPSLTLRSRNQTKWFEMGNEKQTIHSVSSFVAYSVVQIAQTAADDKKFEARIYDYDKQLDKIYFADETIAIGKPQIVGKTFALSSVAEKGAVVALYEVSGGKIAEFTMLKSKDCAVKLDENFLIIIDEFGRVIIFDYKEKILRSNLRF